MSRQLVLACAVLAACARPPASEDDLASHTAALEGAPQLVKDLRTGGEPVGSNPSGFTTIGATTYFVARTPSTGLELWKSDGTAPGTQLVKDVHPGSSDSSPSSLTAMGGKLYFVANDGVHGNELWRSDGTESGTVMVAELRDGTLGWGPEGLVAIGNLLWFSFDDGASGSEPWRSDGTDAGTWRLRDIHPSGSSNARAFVQVGSHVLFGAKDPIFGDELWRTDGTEAGTELVKDIRVAPQPAQGNASDSLPSPFFVRDGWLYFSATDGVSGREVWKTDGTTANTQLVKDINPGAADSQPAFATWVPAANAFLLFANDGTNGPELWRSDGTAQGTSLVKDLAAGPAGSYLQHFTVVGDTLFFGASFAPYGGELWKSDGTADGTAIVKDIARGSANSSPNLHAAHGGLLYFVAESSTFAGRQLWRTDGSDAGTSVVKDLGRSPSLNHVTSTGGRLWFAGDDGTLGQEPWTTDGTPAGTLPVVDLAKGAPGAEPAQLTAMGGRLYFSADDGVTGRELWKTDGTPAGTQLVKDLNPGTSGSGPSLLTPVNGTLFFVGYAGSYGGDLWKSDGTAGGTQLVKKIRTSFGSPDFTSFAASNGRLYFSADDGTRGPEPWVSDGTEAGTRTLGDLVTGTTGSFPNHFVSFNGATWFFAYPKFGAAGQIWRTDGTPEGTTMLVQVHPNDLYARPSNLTPFGSVMLFTSNSENATGIEVWTTDGTQAGTSMLRRIENGGILRVFGPPLVLAGGLAYFVAEDRAAGHELWATDGTPAGTRMVKDIASGPLGSRPLNLVAMGGRVYFSASDGTSGRELWTSDGSTQGTQRVVDLMPGGALGAVNAKPVAGGASGPLLWAGADLASGVEPRIIEEAGSPTLLLGELAPGRQSSNPRDFIRAGNSIYFTADDGTGRELWRWRLPGVVDTTPPTVTCPADLHAEATSASGAAVSFGATASDDQSPSPTVTSTPSSGSTFAFGPTTVQVTATDESGNTARCSFRVIVADTRAPRVTCPQAITAEATGPSGAKVTYSATATDEVTASPTITYGFASGSTFALGTTKVEVTATDGAGHSAQCSFDVTVADTRAPRVTCPPAVVLEATGATGAVVNFANAVATDEVTAAPAITYSTSAGSRFPLGLTKVTATATDAAGNRGQCSFDVTVRDTTAPIVRCPDSISREAEDERGAVVTFIAPTATDLVTAAPAVVLSHQSGSRFPLGSTRVNATATDAAGNVGRCAFDVVVARRVDRAPPVLACPADLEVEATGPEGASVTYAAATATDELDATPSIRYSHASGAVFPLGLTTVNATAADDAGNESSCMFTISVRDTVAPAIQCPSDVNAEAEDASGTAVTFAPATATDAVSAAPAITSDPESGSTFAPGGTVVTFTAKDAAGNASTCTLRVTVEVREETGRARRGGCGCSTPADLGAFALLGLALLRRRRR